MLKRLIPALIASLFAVGLVAGCGTTSEEAKPTVTRMPAANAPGTAVAAEPGTVPATPVVDSSGTDGAAGVAIKIVSRDIVFDPATIEIAADTDVTVALPNEGAAPHNFSIDALEINIDIAAGTEQFVVINAPAGEYDYYCNVPGHKEAGMVGKLVVK